jgi:hypothetical protein
MISEAFHAGITPVIRNDWYGVVLPQHEMLDSALNLDVYFLCYPGINPTLHWKELLKLC